MATWLRVASHCCSVIAGVDMAANNLPENPRKLSSSRGKLKRPRASTMKTFSHSLTSCRGCAPQHTFTYKIHSMTPGVTFVRLESTTPPPGTMGGNITYTFHFTVDEEVKAPTVVFGKYNGHAEPVGEIVHTA
jgi:hypothetical protein